MRMAAKSGEYAPMRKKRLIEPDSEIPAFAIGQEKITLYEGLWESWIRAGFTFFYREICKEMVKFLYDPYYSSKNPKYPFFSRFITYINEYYDVDKAFLAARGLKTRYGICWIRYRIQKFYNLSGSLPSPADLPFLHVHLNDYDYIRFGYSSWERLIAQNLLKPAEKDRLKFMVLDW